MALDGSEISFDLDRYGNPVYLSDKDSLVQVVLNALLMVPGNLPSNPNKGVNILQYLYKDIDTVQSDIIYQSLVDVCGEIVVGSNINGVTVSNQTLSDGRTVLMIVVSLRDPNGAEDSLALLLERTDQHVKFNYSYMSDSVSTV